LILGAILLLLLANLLQSWCAGNATARRSQRAIGFMVFGGYVIAFSVVLLITGLVLLWIAIGFFSVVVGALVYFLVLPFLVMPLLTALNVIPRRG
jgi:hypothetical protein